MKNIMFLLLLLTTTMSFAQDPALQNGSFDKILYKPASASTCSCAHWINTDLGEQAESSTWTKPVDGGESIASQGIKLNDLDTDVLYQEVEVLANQDYNLSYLYRISAPKNTGGNTSVEIRILKGSGYNSGYTPTYYTDAQSKPLVGFGYTDIADVENASNNIHSINIAYPGDENNYTGDFTFNTGSETSIVIFSRSIGGIAPVSPAWSSGDSDGRVDSFNLTLSNTVSVDEYLEAEFNVYPNPVKDYIQIETNGIPILTVEIFNMIGEKLISESELINQTLDVSSLKAGVYQLKINTENSSMNKSIIIK